MDIDWSQLVWQGRWTALEIFWNAILLNIATHWWFAPLLLMLVLAGWRAVLRFVAYVVRVFAHAH